MSAKIINSHRYKKTTRKKADENKERIKASAKYRREKLKDSKIRNKNHSLNKSTIDNKYVNKKNIKKYKSFNFLKILGLISCIALIAIISKIIVKKQSQPVVQADFNIGQKVTLVQDYDLKIGMSKLDSNDYLKSKNIILNELTSSLSNRLVSINKDYTINYIVAKSIKKIDNKQYFIELDSKYNINVEDIENAINEIKKSGEDNIYYKYISNIESIQEQGKNEFTINLKAEDPYFVYSLAFPLVNVGNEYPYFITKENDNSVLFTRNKSNSTLKSIHFTGYSDIDNMINDFKNGKIDIFTASSDSIMQLIGKYEYNVKKYRDGQNIFLLGNKDSKVFSQKEVRQALLYSLNREEIVKKINPTFSEVIDIPYIYSNIRYKYDIVGAKNILLQQGWNNDKGLNKKTIDGQELILELTLLVNENDNIKVQIADMIKDMAENVGIRINIKKAKDNELTDIINKKLYDIILADVYVNDIPDVTYLEDYINLNDKLNSALNIVKQSSIEELPKNILTLQDVISDEIACIGILARNTNVVYQKNINGFEDINYMKVFYNLENVGKIQEVNEEE